MTAKKFCTHPEDSFIIIKGNLVCQGCERGLPEQGPRPVPVPKKKRQLPQGRAGYDTVTI